MRPFASPLRTGASTTHTGIGFDHTVTPHDALAHVRGYARGSAYAAPQNEQKRSLTGDMCRASERFVCVSVKRERDTPERVLPFDERAMLWSTPHPVARERGRGAAPP